MELKLPNIIVSNFDVARILRELAALDDFFTAAAARPAGTPITPPKISRSLSQVANDNRYNLLDEAQRKKLEAQLTELKQQAPLIHISFAVDPPARALEGILVWLRTNINPHTLLQVGLQPNLAAGCVLRTPNHWIDMSLRSRLLQQEDYLIQLIAGAARG